MKIISYSVTQSVGALTTATADVLLDTGETLEFGKKVTLSLTTKAPLASAVNHTIFVGRVSSFTPKYDMPNGGRVYTVTLTSYAYLLNTIPVVTSSMTGSVSSIISTLAAVYGGSSMFSVESGGPTLTGVVIEENSILKGIERLAEIANWVWYVSENGLLMIKPYGEASAGNFDADDISGEVSDNNNEIEEFSAVKVRGKYKTEGVGFITLYEGGLTCDVDAGNSSYATGTIDLTDLQTSLSTNFDSGAIENAVVITRLDSSGDQTIKGEIESYEPNLLKLKFTTSVPGGWAGSTAAIWIKVIADVRSEQETVTLDSKGLGTGHNFVQTKSGLVNMFRLGTGRAFAIADQQCTRLNNETTDNRYEKTVNDASLISQLGLKYQEIDNPYAEEGHLASIAAFALACTKKNSRKLTFTGPFTSAYPLNHTVTVPLIVGGGTHDGVVVNSSTVNVTGIVTSKTITVNAESGSAEIHYEVSAGA